MGRAEAGRSSMAEDGGTPHMSEGSGEQGSQPRRPYQEPLYALSFSVINYAQAFISFLITFYLARATGVKIFGDYRLGMTCMNIVSVAGLYGADTALVNDLVQGRPTGPTVINYSVVRLVFGLASTIAVSLWAWYAYHAEPASAFIPIYALGGIAIGLSLEGWFDYAGYLRRHATLLFLERVLFLVGCFALILMAGKPTAMVLGAIALLTRMALLSVEYGTAFRGGVSGVRRNISKPVIVSILSRHQWLWYASLANLLRTNVSQLVLDFTSGREQIAYFGLAMQLIMLVRLMQEQAMRLLAPSIATATVPDGDLKVAARTFRQAALRIGGGSMVAALLVVVAGNVVIDHLFPDFAPAKPAMLVLALWVSIRGVGLVSNRFLIGFGMQRVAFDNTIVSGVLALVLTFVLAPHYGAVGVAVAFGVSHALSIAGQAFSIYLRIRS